MEDYLNDDMDYTSLWSSHKLQCSIPHMFLALSLAIRGCCTEVPRN